MNEVYVKTLQKGRDGIGIKEIEINDSGELVITYTNGLESNLGKVVNEAGAVSDEVIAEKINEYLKNNPELVVTIPVITETSGTEKLDSVIEEGQYVYINNAGARCTLFVTAYSIPGDSDTEYDAIAVTQTLIRPNELETGVVPGIYFRNGYDIGVGFEWVSEFKEVAYKEDIPDDLQDGFSPIVTITPISGGNRVTITDALEPHVFDVMNGANGDPGEDGFSPSLHTEEIDNGYTLYCNTESGLVKLCDIYHGRNGEDATGGTLLFDVTAFGALGDGETDDSAALQDAFNACNDAGGGVVFFPTGTYMIGNALGTNQYVEFYSNTHVLGELGTVLKFHSSVADIISSSGTDTQVQPISLLRNHTEATQGGYTATKNVVIENITFDCNSDFAKKSTTVGLGHARNVIIRNCHWVNGKSSDLNHHHYLELNGCKDIKVIDCTFKGSLVPGTDGTSEMVNIDRATSGSYGYQTYYKYDDTACDNIEITRCKFETYAKADFPSGYYPSSAIGTHGTATNANAVKIHDCHFEGDWYASGQNRNWVIRFYGNQTNCMVYNNIFIALTSASTSKPIGVCMQGSTSSNFIYNNTFINYDPNNMTSSANDTDKTAVRFNNYCYTTSDNSVVSDSGTINLSNGVLSIT